MILRSVYLRPGIPSIKPMTCMDMSDALACSSDSDAAIAKHGQGDGVRSDLQVIIVPTDSAAGAALR